MTPTYRRSDDHNAVNRHLLAETEARGGNRYHKLFKEDKRRMTTDIVEKKKYFMDNTIHELHMKFIVRNKYTKEIIALFTSADRATKYKKELGENYELKESY
jgi:hypothetical protein